MRLFEFTLTETIDNLFMGDERREKYKDQVFDIITLSYAPSGGMQGSGFNDADDMVAQVPYWKLFRRGDTVKAVMLYKDKNGRKRVAIGTDGSNEAKTFLKKMLTDEYLSGRSHAEVSGPSLGLAKKLLGDMFADIALDYEQVADVFKSKVEKGQLKPTSDPYIYSRLINGQWHDKTMLGVPNVQIKR